MAQKSSLLSTVAAKYSKPPLVRKIGAEYSADILEENLAILAQQAKGVEVWSQHLDPVGLGGYTGWLEPQTALHRGAKGSIINHAEHKVELDHVRKLARRKRGGDEST